MQIMGMFGSVFANRCLMESRQKTTLVNLVFEASESHDKNAPENVQPCFCVLQMEN